MSIKATPNESRRTTASTRLPHSQRRAMIVASRRRRTSAVTAQRATMHAYRIVRVGTCTDADVLYEGTKLIVVVVIGVVLVAPPSARERVAVQHFVVAPLHPNDDVAAVNPVAEHF